MRQKIKRLSFWVWVTLLFCSSIHLPVKFLFHFSEFCQLSVSLTSFFLLLGRLCYCLKCFIQVVVLVERCYSMGFFFFPLLSLSSMS